jgi:hypothetical protein
VAADKRYWNFGVKDTKGPVFEESLLDVRKVTHKLPGRAL